MRGCLLTSIIIYPYIFNLKTVKGNEKIRNKQRASTTPTHHVSPIKQIKSQNAYLLSVNIQIEI